MEIKEALRILEKNLEAVNEELGFKMKNSDDKSVEFFGDKGSYRIVYDSSSKIFSFDCAYNTDSEEAQYNTVSRSLFDNETYNEKDAKSLANEIRDELLSLFKSKKKVDLDKIKMPKAVSRTKAKNGLVSYDADSLANRFGTLYPEYKDEIKLNISKYGEFLPETFFIEHGTAKVLEVIASGNDAECHKLFKMLNEVYEDGTNEVQDIIGVTILGAMKNDPKLMEVADKYMSDYMSGPVHEINKITRKKNKLTKMLENPPAYKPKKKKFNPMESALQQQGR